MLCDMKSLLWNIDSWPQTSEHIWSGSNFNANTVFVIYKNLYYSKDFQDTTRMSCWLPLPQFGTVQEPDKAFHYHFEYLAATWCHRHILDTTKKDQCATDTLSLFLFVYAYGNNERYKGCLFPNKRRNSLPLSFVQYKKSFRWKSKAPGTSGAWRKWTLSRDCFVKKEL